MQMNRYQNTDIRDLILLCRQRDDSAFDELVRRYTPMIRKVVSAFEDTSCDFDELFAEGCVALHIAAGRYDLDQNEVTFGLYARICVRNRILDLIRRTDKGNTDPEVDVEQMSDDVNTPEQDLVDREIFDRLRLSARALLSDYEYRVLLLHIQGYKTAAIASMLGKSSKSVDNAKSRMFRRLRGEIGDISRIL